MIRTERPVPFALSRQDEPIPYALTRDGWEATGDVHYVLSDGTLTGRLRRVFPAAADGAE